MQGLGRLLNTRKVECFGLRLKPRTHCLEFLGCGVAGLAFVEAYSSCFWIFERQRRIRKQGEQILTNSTHAETKNADSETLQNLFAYWTCGFESWPARIWERNSRIPTGEARIRKLLELIPKLGFQSLETKLPFDWLTMQLLKMGVPFGSPGDVQGVLSMLCHDETADCCQQSQRPWLYMTLRDDRGWFQENVAMARTSSCYGRMGRVG